MSDNCQFKYLNRSASNQSDKGVLWMYTNGSESFDTTLVSADGRTVMAHAYALALFSEYFENKVNESVGLFTYKIELPNMSYEIVHNVVKLFYLREVFLPIDLKEQMIDALHFLLVDDDDINVLQQDKLNRQKVAAATQTPPKQSPRKVTQRRNTGAMSPQEVAVIRKRSPSTSSEVAPPVAVASGSRPNVVTKQAPAPIFTSAVNIMGRSLSQLTITKTFKPKDVNGSKAPGPQLEMKKAAAVKAPVAAKPTKLPTKIVEKVVPAVVPTSVIPASVVPASKASEMVAQPSECKNESKVVKPNVLEEKEAIADEIIDSIIGIQLVEGQEVRRLFPERRNTTS